MWRVTNKRVQSFIKYDVIDDFNFNELSYQQAFDLIEGYSYTKKGSNTVLMKLLTLIKHHFDT